ncbi:MAG TPA: histidinol-phosphate aminotransferase, partial [Leptolyngbyaceae cyanobacterium M65_K2018_010]|nr:histidinol-phosphate aminotransferase [Leptolyngbyaceae cyanobacterium M65_K2018_010]
MALPFLRSEVIQLTAYTPHPGEATPSSTGAIDHLDTNESPYDLPPALKQ